MFNITALQEMYAWLNNEYLLEGAIYDFWGFEANYFFVIDLRNFLSILYLYKSFVLRLQQELLGNPKESKMSDENSEIFTLTCT